MASQQTMHPDDALMDPEIKAEQDQDQVMRSGTSTPEIDPNWIPSYLYLTAYGERFKHFGSSTKEQQQQLLQQQQQQQAGGPPIDDDKDDDNSSDIEPVAPTRFNLPQIFPTRSAALLDDGTTQGGTDMMAVDSLDFAKKREKSHSDKLGSTAGAAKSMSRKEIGVAQIPQFWSPPPNYEKTNNFLAISKDNLRLEFNDTKTQQRDVTLRTNNPIPRLCGVFYYEVGIEQVGNEDLMSIGICTNDASSTKLPGLEQNSWGYHSDDGRIIANQGTAKTYGPNFGQGDTVGCGYNFRKKTIFYTKNGLPLGVAFKDVDAASTATSVGCLYPTIGIRTGQVVNTNFGQEQFLFDIEKYIRDEKAKIFKEIEDKNVTARAISEAKFEDNDDFIQELVASYFAHVGFLETARAFEAERKGENPMEGVESDHKSAELEVFNRQKIRELILEGRVDEALDKLRECYPAVFDNHDLILFKLRCRKFVELVRNSSGSATTSSELKKVLEYGQELQREYKEDQRSFVKETLNKVFALLAYKDPSEHPEVAELFDKDKLVALADELNSEILVSLGKPSVPSLKKLAQHTTQLVWEMSDQGFGNSSNLINVGQDFME